MWGTLEYFRDSEIKLYMIKLEKHMKLHYMYQMSRMMKSIILSFSSIHTLLSPSKFCIVVGCLIFSHHPSSKLPLSLELALGLHLIQHAIRNFEGFKSSW